MQCRGFSKNAAGIQNEKPRTEHIHIQHKTMCVFVKVNAWGYASYVGMCTQPKNLKIFTPTALQQRPLLGVLSEYL